jgi:hypothetical protein
MPMGLTYAFKKEANFHGKFSGEILIDSPMNDDFSGFD